MPIYSIKGPDGKTYSLEGPAGATREQVIQEVKKQQYNQLISGSNKQREGTAGFFEGIVGGTKNILSGSQTAVEAPFISGEEAALRGIERQKNRTERPGFSLDEIIKTYDQDGLFSAAGETLSQIPGAIGEQLPFLASMKAGFAAGSALPLPPQAKLLAGVAGSLLTPFLVSSGSAMERKASEQLKRGDKVDINELGAYGTGLASAGLERAALGLSGLSKVMGIDFLKGAGTETAEQIARRSLAATLAKGGGKLVAAEVPTEMGQQALERYYAGLSLTDEEAMREYAEAGAGAAMLAPLGMAGSAYQRSQVKRQIKNAEADTEKKLKEKNRIKEEEDRQNELDEAAMEANRQARIEEDIQIRAAIKAERETALQKAREATGEPVRSIQDIINEMTGVVKPKLDAEGEETGQFQERKPLTGKKLTARQKQFQEGLDAPSGQFVSGVDGIERPRTAAEAQGIPVQEYDPTKQKLTKEFITTKKGLGIGGTAKAFGLDHGEGPVPTLKDFLDGKDPTNVEDNGMIRLTLNENLKTRRKGLDDAPSLEAQQKRQEVITKIETYLTALPTTQELENAEYQKALDAEAARRSNEVDDESAATDAFLSSVNDTGRTDGPTITSDELAGRAGPEPTSLVDPETGQEVDLTGALTKEEFDRQQLEATNKEMTREARVIRQKAKKAEPLRKFLNKMGIARSQMYDITGDTKGKTMMFRNNANLIEDIVSDNQGNILQYAPADMVARANLDNPNMPSDTTELVNFFRDKIRADDLDFRPTDIEQTLFDADMMEESVAKATGAIVDINGESIPQTLIDAYKSRKPDRDSTLPNLRTSDFYRELEKYLGPVFSGRTVSDLENLLEEYTKGQTQDLRYVVFGKIKGTNEETVWQEQIGNKQRAEEVAKTLEREGKATDTRVQEYDLNLGPMGIPQESTTQPAATPTQEQRVKQTLEGSNVALTDKEKVLKNEIARKYLPRIEEARNKLRPIEEAELAKVIGNQAATYKVMDKQEARRQKAFKKINDEGMAEFEARRKEEATPTQEQRVKQTLEESDTPLTIKEIAEQTNILEPNVRRITGQGAKAGKFERVAPGVYTLTTPDGKKIAHIEVGDAVNVLPKLVEQGEKFDMIFLDPAYFSRALMGGNRGIKDYEFMKRPEFKKAMKSVPNLIKETDGHVYLMLSGAPSAQQDMLPYLNAMNEVGLSVVGEGEYKKLFKNGKPVTNVRGKEASAERIFLFTKSGIARKGEKTLDNLNFRFVRPSVRSSYSTEKAPQLLNALITNSTFEGESVLDPFAGSGVTGAEAVKAGRQATLVEKSEKAVEDYIIPKIEGAQDNIQESRTETEQDKLAFELREAEYQAGSYIKASERVPKRLRDRIKKLKEQLSVQESRSDTLGPVETADSITESLRKEFGSDIDKAIDSGQLVIVNHLHELPNSFKFEPTANGTYDPTSNKVYIVASKVMPGQGRKVLLHELGEHYGLERMLGDSYGATLGRLNSLKNTDPKVKAVWDEVGRQYPELEVGGKLYLQEVMAKIGEQSPQNTLFKRVVAAVKNFLRKLGFFNPNTLTTADMQDLIMYSTRSALAKSDKVTGSQLAAGQMQMQLSKEELKTIAGWSEKRQRAFFNDPSFDNENAWDSRVMYFVTMMSPQQFLDLATPISVEQLDTSIDKKFNTGKGESGLKNELLKWDSELSIKGATAGLGRQPYLSIQDSKIVGHEGRHRARALQRLGIKQFPVVIEGKRSVIFDTEATYRDPAAKDISFDSMEVTAQGRSTKETIGRMVGISKNNRPELRAMVDTATNPEMSQDIMFSKEEGPGAFKAAQEAATRLLGLPPDNTAMDRARAMGFDVDNIFYHGTTKDFDAFELDPNKVGPRERDFSHLGKAYEGKYYFSGDGIYLTQNQEVAKYFAYNTAQGETETAAAAILQGEKPNKVGTPKVMPLMVKGEIFDFRNPEHIERIKQPYQNYNESEKGLPGTSRLNKTEINNIAKGLHSAIENNHVVFQRLGFDGAKMFEPKRFFSQQNLDKNAITTVIYNPVNIRSTDAAFNPESTTSPNLMFSKTDVPAGLEQTSVYLSGVKDDSKTFYNNFVEGGFDKLINQPVDTLASLWNQVRIKMAYSGAGIERKLVNEYEGAVTKGLGVRADIIMSQALDDSVMASQSAAEGKVVLGEDRVARVVIDENNINNLVKLRQQLADQTSIELAEGLIQSYTSARRYRLELDRVEQRAANIASRKQAIKTANQELKTAKGDDKKQLNKLITRYQKQNERDKEKNESITITPEQEAAIEPGLAYAQQYPVLVEVGAMIDAINKNRIDLLEQSGVYTKDMADDYRDREGYVPLFREMIEDLGKGDQTITQYFSGFADIGREYGFTGSDRDTKHVLGNLLQQHFWAVSASLRNNANYEAAKQVGLHDDQNNLILYDKKPETGTAAPVMVDGERKFVEYSDPALAVGIQGALPVYKGILKYFGMAAKWFRLGITANPFFQSYQVINDALGAAMYSGVRSPLKLGKEIIGGYVRDQYFRDTKAIDDQMARLGIAGGFGRTPGDIFLKAQRQLGVENMNKWQKLVDATDAFASRSDLAQRRGIFVQTLLESGGVRQADGSVAGGNEILAMNRALNIINWQKRGASSSVRTMTHVIPFANAYLQGMDVLLNAMAGKGLSGTDAQTARILFLKTALALTMFNMLYSMVVAGEEEYDELDDRIKFRNYIVPGTGFKLPVRAEISLLTKYIPEQAYQYVTKLGTTNEVDATKLFNGMSLAVRDAAMGPNLFPQLIRGSVEVATNYNFYTGRPLIGLGLSRLDTAEQYNEATSELAKLLGSTGMVAPINADHIIRSYFGTVGSTALFVMDQAANTMIGNEKPALRLKDFPLISPLLYTAQGRDKLNDFYELKQASDEATATVNRLMKYDPKKAFEYRKDNARMIGTRKQVNRLSKNLKDLRARRKLIIESGMDGDKKRAALTNVEKQMNNVVRSIARLRIASGL